MFGIFKKKAIAAEIGLQGQEVHVNPPKGRTKQRRSIMRIIRLNQALAESTDREKNDAISLEIFKRIKGLEAEFGREIKSDTASLEELLKSIEVG